MVLQPLKIQYCPHSKQRPFHDDKTKFRGIITGVGFGKSASGVNELIKKCILKPGGTRLLMGPTLPMVKNTTLVEFFKFVPKELILKHNKGDKEIYLNTDPVSKIIYLSGDNERDIDRLRGLTLRDAYGDELCLCPYYVFEIIIARLRDPGGDCSFWITTTPKGFGWLHDIFIEKINPRSKQPHKNPSQYKVFKGTTYDNPYTPDEYKQTLEDTYVGVFAKQELMGEFVGFEGLVYMDFNSETHVVNEFPEFKEFIGGGDFGFTNPSVALVIGVDGDGRFWLVEELYQAGLTQETYVSEVKKFHDKYNFSNFYCDPAAPEYIQALNNVGVPAVGVKCTVMEGITLFTQRLKKAGDGLPRFFVHERCVHTIMEFGNYRYPDSKDDKPIQENPMKIHDHAMDSVRYANFGYNKRVDFRIEYLDF